MFPSTQEIQKTASQFIPGAEEALSFNPLSTVGDYGQSVGEFAAPLGLFGKAGRVASVTGGVAILKQQNN